jgi:hypothetical protein
MDTNVKLILSQSRLDRKDEKILLPTLDESPIVFGTTGVPTEFVQMHVYDMDGNRIISTSDLKMVEGSNFRFEKVVQGTRSETVLFTDPVQDLKNLKLRTGTYRSVYTFLRYYLSFGGSFSKADWFIQDISTSRREVRVVTTQTTPVTTIVNDVEVTTMKNIVGAKFTKSDLDFKKKSLQDESPTGTFLLDLGNNNFAVVINQTVSGESLLFKLYKPLPDDIEEKTSVTPYFELARPIEVISTIVNEFDTEQPVKTLRGRNTNVFVGGLYQVGTAYQSWNDLLSTNPQTSQDLLDHFLSSSNNTETVNVDYSDYGNFVHFSSAEERVRNFQYKLQLLEQYDATIGALQLTMASGSATVSQSVSFYGNLKRNVLNGFDGYENWLYWESGSTYSSSLGWGEVTQSTWPKSNSTYPYVLYSVTSSQGVNWLNNQLEVANLYDRNNTHNLLKTAPFHIREDEENNESYLTFLQMMGQHYDVLWTYAKHINQRYDIQHKLTEGTAKDVIWDTMKSFGMDLTNGNDVSSLWKYAFGTDVTGSYGNNIFQMTYKDSAREIWKRLFNNLSYLLKSKGTVRGIKAMITCYGIPSTLLRVKEYGGPDPDLAFESTKYIADEFSYTLDFDGHQVVSQSWFSPKPNSVEFRFLVNPEERTSMVLFEAYNAATPATNFKLSITPDYTPVVPKYKILPQEIVALRVDGVDAFPESTSYVTMSGHFLLEVSGGVSSSYALSNEVPVYDGAYWSVLLERTQPSSSGQWKLWAKQTSNGRIVQEASFSINLTGAVSNSWDGATVFAIGSSSVGKPAFTGNMQEFRLWSTALNEDVFDNHVLAPTAYNGNTYSSSYYDLALRWRMNNAEWYTSASYNTLLLDSNPSQGTLHHGYWSGSNSASVIANLDETNYYESPSVGLRRMNSNKVRVDTYVSQSGDLSPVKRVTLSRFDTAPLDSNKVGVFLAPTEMINEDIIRTFAGENFDNWIGSPLDANKSRYPDLDAVNTWYWTKYGTNPNIYTYMRALSYFDKSLYDNIRKMLPARVEATVGFLFEQHMLERSRNVDVTNIVPSWTDYRVTIDIHELNTFTGAIQPLNAFALYLTGSGPIGTNEGLTATQSLQATPFRNPYSYQILDMMISNNVLTMNSSSYFVWSATGSIILPACDFWLDPASKDPVTGSFGQVVGYSGSHYIFHRQRFTGLENLWYDGCVQTIDTTTDKGLPFESIEAPPNILVVVDATADKPRLNVE